MGNNSGGVVWGRGFKFIIKYGSYFFWVNEGVN